MTDKIQKLELAYHEIGVGPAPERFGPESTQAWNDLVAIAPPGKWIRSDEFMLAILANALAVTRHREIKPDPILFKIPEETIIDVLAHLPARFLLGPEDFEYLVGFKYPKAWPDPAIWR